MTTKEALITNVKEWISLDDKLKSLQKEIKKKRTNGFVRKDNESE